MCIRDRYTTLRLIEIMLNERQKNDHLVFSDLLKDLPIMHVSPEIRIPTEEARKLKIITNFTEMFKKEFPELASDIKGIVDIDGIRLEFSDGWGLVRASNTQPALVMRFEATTDKKLNEYEESFEKIIELLREEELI